jgi:phosphatidylglycerol---prolipoprotein diacylglyceryl transferase
MFPEIKLSDTFIIPTYLLYLSLLYSFLVIYVSGRVDHLDRPRKEAFDLALVLMMAGFAGARLLHIAFEMPAFYWENPVRILQFWEGGFVFFGGLGAGAIGFWIYCWRKKISFLEWADFYAPVGALGYGLGRVSCLLAGCCYGRACDMPWAIQLGWDQQHVWRHPTQAYAIFWELALYVVLLGLEKRRYFEDHKGVIFFFWMTFHGLGRLLMEAFRDDFRGDLIWGQTISTWFSLLLIVGGIAGLFVRIQHQTEPRHG